MFCPRIHCTMTRCTNYPTTFCINLVTIAKLPLLYFQPERATQYNTEYSVIEIESDNRKNSLQQCPINKSRIKCYYLLLNSLCFTSTTNCNCENITSSEQVSLAIHVAWLCKSWITLSIGLIIIQSG